MPYCSNTGKKAAAAAEVNLFGEGGGVEGAVGMEVGLGDGVDAAGGVREFGVNSA